MGANFNCPHRLHFYTHKSRVFERLALIIAAYLIKSDSVLFSAKLCTVQSEDKTIPLKRSLVAYLFRRICIENKHHVRSAGDALKRADGAVFLELGEQIRISNLPKLP